MDNHRGANDFSSFDSARVPIDVTRGDWKEKLNGWKSRGLDYCRNMSRTMSDKTHSMQRSISTKTADMKRMVAERSAQVEPMIHDTMDKVDRELHSNPTKWAGIAAGASFALGMIGREVRHRVAHKHAKRMMPELIIIETA